MILSTFRLVSLGLLETQRHLRSGKKPILECYKLSSTSFKIYSLNGLLAVIVTSIVNRENYAFDVEECCIAYLVFGHAVSLDCRGHYDGEL